MKALRIGPGDPLQPGDSVLFIDQKEREYIRILRPRQCHCAARREYSC